MPHLSFVDYKLLISVGISQAERHRTLTPAFHRFESGMPSYQNIEIDYKILKIYNYSRSLLLAVRD